jgi:hypothetical protein
MADDRMTSAEAERRLDSIFICGGTPEERRFAIKRWTDALAREWYVQRSAEKKATAKAVR